MVSVSTYHTLLVCGEPSMLAIVFFLKTKYWSKAIGAMHVVAV